MKRKSKEYIENYEFDKVGGKIGFSFTKPSKDGKEYILSNDIPAHIVKKGEKAIRAYVSAKIDKLNKIKVNGVNDHIHIASLEALTFLKGTLNEITDQEAKDRKYHQIGQPFGASLEHCLFMGIKYSDNFEDKVKYYVIHTEVPRTDHRYAVTRMNLPQPVVCVDFYGEKEQ